MKCPKCQYLGFDGQSRCRHCGYDLSLAPGSESDTAVAATGPEETEPMTTLDVAPRQEPSARAQARAAIQKRAQRTPQPEAFDLPLFATPGVDDRPALPASRPPLAVRRPADAPRARASFAPGTGGAAAGAAYAKAPIPDSAPPAQAPAPRPDVPGVGPVEPDLEARFDPALDRGGLADTTEAIADDAAEPDLPLTLGGTPLEGPVRASGGALTLPGRESSHTASAGFARARWEPIVVDAPRVEPVVVAAPRAERPLAPAAETLPILRAPASDEPPAPDEPADTVVADDADPRLAAPGRRLMAGAVDLAVIAAVDVAVVAATLRASGLELHEIDRLPVAPLVTFLVLLAIGYLAMCTVLAGRTFGKSVFGLAVVETGGRPVRLAPAVVRALIQVVSIAAGGLGFLPALLGADRRALYDRLAGTEVIRDPLAAEAPQPE
jgi:uncharacterized RDD family membrane protein YckC